MAEASQFGAEQRDTDPPTLGQVTRAKIDNGRSHAQYPAILVPRISQLLFADPRTLPECAFNLRGRPTG